MRLGVRDITFHRERANNNMHKSFINLYGPLDSFLNPTMDVCARLCWTTGQAERRRCKRMPLALVHIDTQNRYIYQKGHTYRIDCIYAFRSSVASFTILLVCIVQTASVTLCIARCLVVVYQSHTK